MKKNLYDESRGDSLHVTDSKAINRQKSVTTEIVFILDRSGSMEGLEADTIGGFNSMMKKQKEEPGEALVSTVLFDDVCEVIHDRVPLDEVKKLTGKEYFVRGCTALLDAVGGASITSGTSTSTLAKRLDRKRRCSSSPPTGWRMPAITTPMRRSRRWWSGRRKSTAGNFCSSARIWTP